MGSCKPKTLSGCLSAKQIQYLNDKFPQLPFELGCVLDEAFLKITKELNMKCFYECDSTNTTFFTHIDGTGVRTEWTDSTMTTPYVSVPPLKPAPTDRPRGDIEFDIIEAQDQEGLCIWIKKLEGIDASGNPLNIPPRYFTEPDCINEITDADFVSPLVPKSLVQEFEQIPNTKQTIEVNDTDVITLTPPAGATGAQIISVAKDCIRVCSDGSTPTPTTGDPLPTRSVFTLGCLSADTLGGDPDELANFQAIAEVGSTATLTVTYYTKV